MADLCGWLVVHLPREIRLFGRGLSLSAVLN